MAAPLTLSGKEDETLRNPHTALRDEKVGGIRKKKKKKITPCGI